MESEYEIKSEREFIAYSDLWHTANVLLEQANKIEVGKTHIVRAALVFRAFAFEAFLLHIGARFFPENKQYAYMSVKDKLVYIDQKYSMGINFGAGSFQTITILFDKRSKLAHAKDDRLNETYTSKFDKGADNYYERKLKTDIENYCVIENAIKAKEDAQKSIEAIADRVGIDKSELFRMGMQYGSMNVTTKADPL
jgi:hypothetical protein